MAAPSGRQAGLDNGCSMQGREANIGTPALNGIDLGSMVDEKASDRRLVLLGCVVEERLVITGTIIDVPAR
jgi:hypothetical protein